MKTVINLCEQTKKETNGFFNIRHNHKYDPLGLVKGWAIFNAASLLKKKGYKNFYLEAGGDIQVYGRNSENKPWKIGIRNPFNRNQNIKIIEIENVGVATSGSYIRGQHIYNPHAPDQPITDIVSLTIIGPDVYEADRFATAAFAMGKKGIEFIEKLKGFEGYQIDSKGTATFTGGFNNYQIKNETN
jgi:thiamine biosynthesis lipoprotein